MEFKAHKDRRNSAAIKASALLKRFQSLFSADCHERETVATAMSANLYRARSAASWDASAKSRV
jgi:hypothetical protein